MTKEEFMNIAIDDEIKTKDNRVGKVRSYYTADNPYVDFKLVTEDGESFITKDIYTNLTLIKKNKG